MNQKEQIPEYEHVCRTCEEGFFEGSQFGEEGIKFCQPCIDQIKHIEFYRRAGLSSRMIYDYILNKEEKLNH